jgi:type IV pilus modification protein PilV
MNTRRQSGFTLWELLMTLLVAGILFGIGVPNVMEFQRNSVMTATANDFVTAVLAARTEAVKRQVPVTLCLVDDPAAAAPPDLQCEPDPVADSTRGFIVWVDENGNVDGNGIPIITDGTDGNAVIDGGETILRRGTVQQGTMLVSTNCGYVSFGPTGVPRQAPGECFPFAGASPWAAFLFCDDRWPLERPLRSCRSLRPRPSAVGARRRKRRRYRADHHHHAEPGGRADLPVSHGEEHMNHMRTRNTQTGFGLVESLVALVVVSVGMIGIAALYGQGLGAGRTALFRTQAVNLAADMADRIRVNRLGGPSYGGAAADNNCDPGGNTNCSAAEMAAHDLFVWQAAVAAQMPNGVGTVQFLGTTPPTYTISVDWQEVGIDVPPHQITIRVPSL